MWIENDGDNNKHIFSVIADNYEHDDSNNEDKEEEEDKDEDEYKSEGRALARPHASHATPDLV